MHVSKGYNQEVIFGIPCIQLCKKAVDVIDLNPVTTNISAAKGHAVIFKDGLVRESTTKVLLQHFSEEECTACILINSCDNFDLITSDMNYDDYNFPIYLLKKQHGTQLLDQMSGVSKVCIKTEIVQQSASKLSPCECIISLNCC